MWMFAGTAPASVLSRGAKKSLILRSHATTLHPVHQGSIPLQHASSGGSASHTKLQKLRSLCGRNKAPECVTAKRNGENCFHQGVISAVCDVFIHTWWGCPPHVTDSHMPAKRLPLCTEWKDKQSFYTWHWNVISAPDQRKSSGNSRLSRLGIVVTLSGQHVFGLRRPKWAYFCSSPPEKSQQRTHNVKWCVVYWVYKQILCGAGMWNAYLDGAILVINTANVEWRVIKTQSHWGRNNEKPQFSARSNKMSARWTCEGLFRWMRSQKVACKIPKHEGSRWENKQYEKFQRLSPMASSALLSPLSHDHIPVSELDQLQ